MRVLPSLTFIVLSLGPTLRLIAQEVNITPDVVHVTSDDAPTLLLAGAKDELVPIFHSRYIQAAFEKANVTSQLIEFENAGHNLRNFKTHASGGEQSRL